MTSIIPQPFKYLYRKSRLSQAIPPILSVLLLLVMCTMSLHGQNTAKPNIIFILADDLGYGDLSSYGQKLFQTPNIDKLAAQGIRFTNHYAGAPVCAPSRSALMTGLHTGHTSIRGNKEVQPEGQWPLPADTYTLVKMMKSAGYRTGVFGKWGLGYPGSAGAPEHQGVDTFFGYNCQRLAHNYYPEYLWDNTDKIVLDGNTGSGKTTYAPEIIHERVLQFLEDQRDSAFFLFYPMVIPHAELAAPEKYMARYRGRFLPEKSFEGVDDGAMLKKGPYGSQREAHAAFAAMIHLMDDQVGSIVDKVAALGLDQNTLIIFASDNGPHTEGGGDPGYFDSNGILRGYKRDVYEGGIRVPMIARWNGRIKPAQATDHVSAFWDVMPTLAELLDITITNDIDGVSYLPTLLGEPEKQKQHKYLYWEFHELGGRMALRAGDWKIVQYNVLKDPPGSFELYNLKDDPSEKDNVAAKFPKKVKELKKAMLRERVPSDAFPFGESSPK